MRNPPGTGVLVVQAQGAEPFIQFTGGPEGVEMDFPLVTSFQKSHEQRIRSFCDKHHLYVRVNFGSDGSSFLDVDLPPDPAAISATVRAAFAEIFDLHEPLAVEYSHEGLMGHD